MTAVSIFIAAVTILHILGYIGLVYWTTHIKAGGDAKEGEIIDHTWDGDLKEMNNPMPGWWLSLFYLMIAFAIAYLFLYPGVYKGSKGWTQLTQYQQESRRVDARSAEYFRHYAGKSVEDLAKDPDALATGRRIFLQNCAVCHATDAGGTPGNYPNLTDKDWIWGGTPENIINTITNGHTGAMPAGGALIAVAPGQAPSAEDQQKLEDVSNYILALGGYEHDQALAEKGKELYGTSCVACHGPDGKGNPIIGGINLADQTWLYAEDSEDPAALKTFIQNQIQHPRNNVMPAWKDILGEAKIKVVAAYVYSLSQDESADDNAGEEKTTADATAPAAATSEAEKPAAETPASAATETAAPAAEPAATSSEAEKLAAETPAPAATETAASAAEPTAATSEVEKTAAEATAAPAATETAAPAAEPAATSSEAEKPAAETPAPAATETTAPATEPAATSDAEKPAAEATAPAATETAAPVAEPAAASSEAEKPAAEATAPAATETAAPATEPAATSEAEKPAAEATATPAAESEKPANESAAQ